MNEQAEPNECARHYYKSKSQWCCGEDAKNEIGILSYLRRQSDLPVFLLRMIDVFRGDDDYVTLVTEYVDSELFNEVTAGVLPLCVDRVRRYTWQLLQATNYLHEHHT